MNQDKPHILLVEDDPNFGDVLKSYLELNDYMVTKADDGQAGLKAYHEGKFDLAIVDVMMPKMDGFTLAETIRKEDNTIPLIFLTAKNLREDVLKGFDVGADDYITKPFDSQELLFRIKAILKRSFGSSPKNDDRTEFVFGKFHFDYPLRKLTFKGSKGDKVDKLSPKEAELLRMFCIYENEVLERSIALKEIWGQDDYFTARSMDVFITKLRKYLKQDKNIEIVNIHGNGFQLRIHNKGDQE